MTAITKRRHAELAGQAAKFVAELLLIAPMSPAFDHKLEQIEALGRDTIARAAACQAGAFGHVARAPTDGIARAIAAMRGLAQSLEPLRPGNLADGAKRFGLFAAKPDPRTYFHRYVAAQGEIDASLRALTRERDDLLRANVALEAQAVGLKPVLAQLEEHALLAQELTATLTARADALAPRDPVRAQRLHTDALHVVHTRARDLAEARALTAQTLGLADIIADTNARLIAGIEQATATMLLVLRTAMEAARLLASQELVLDGIVGLNRAAGNLITEQAPVPGDASAQRLQAAFAGLYDALDRLDTERAGTSARPMPTTR